MSDSGRLHPWSQRFNLKVLLLVLAIGLGINLVGVGHLALAVRSALSPADLQLLLQLIGLLLLVLIPAAGIYSLVSEFAFWEGWLQGLPAPASLFSQAPPATASHRCYVVYLDGIHQLECDHPPRVSAFLELLEQQLAAETLLVRGLETYTVLPVALAEDAGSAWFWRRLFALQDQHPNRLTQLLAAVMVQANNVIKVGISSDRRYGPILNYELALKICLRLAEAGFRPGAGSRIVLTGYSGGAEMAMGVADYLRRITQAPVSIISFCGVFSGNQVLDQLSGITTIVGSKDPVAAFGRIAYPGRSPLLPLSNWNKAQAAGCIQRLEIEGMNHNGSRGPFSERFRLPVIKAILAALESPTAAPEQTGC
ncbi:MAG: alpha/beta hydrolase [Cyanobacteria bacterium M_surface_10_m2_179]|nr:alpha/beta hydrolase [Cyanobacteria bacterium M_surface_10_m2_179]